MPAKRNKPADAHRTYGVLVSKVVDGQLNMAGNSPHYEIWVKAKGDDYRVAVNVRSVDGSVVMVHYDPNFTNPTKLQLPQWAAGDEGLYPVPTGPRGKGLDYLRDGLFDVSDMHPVPADGTGVTLHNLLDGQIERAKADDEAVLIAFGESFSDSGADRTFGFSPERGSHDIHMMQGNEGAFADDNRTNGDGALFIRYSGGETIALFVRFDSQALQTDDNGQPKSA